MKNLLLILPMALSMSVAIAQTPTNDMSSKTTSSLDGKSFKITLTQRVDGSTGMSHDDKSYDNRASGTSTSTTTTTGSSSVGKNPDGTPAGTTTEKNTTTTTDTKTAQNSKMESLSNKKMIIRFDHGMIRSNALTTQGITSCPYNVTSSEGTMMTFNANCSGMSSSQKSNPASPSDVSGTMNSGTNNSGTISSETMKSETTPVDNTGTKETTTGTTTTATATTGGNVKAMWSGTVDGTNVRGNLTWTNDKGESYSYTFTGMKATQKDLDSEQELGSR